jgi:hypothetical protein
MALTERSICSCLSRFCLLTAAVVCCLSYGSSAQAPQSPPLSTLGVKIICGASSNSSTCGTPYYDSYAVIDASVFPGATLCAQINAVQTWINNNLPVGTDGLGTTYPLHYLVDARGITGAALTCASGETPFDKVKSQGSAGYKIGSMVLLLPAGKIAIQTVWNIPAWIELIGVGAGDVAGANSYQTVIQVPANTTWPTGTAILTINGASCCNDVFSVQTWIKNLVLDGNGDTINGINDVVAGSGALVDHVGLYRIGGTGLLIGGLNTSQAAQNSGPYTNITFDVGSIVTNANTSCLQIQGSVATKGIHSFRCISHDTNALAGIRIDSSNNTIEDVILQGFYDGILIGANGPASSNYIANVVDTSVSTQYWSTVHIANTHPVADLSIVGVSNDCTVANSQPCKTVTIQDDWNTAAISDTIVGAYMIGNRNSTGAFSRFSTSTQVSAQVSTTNVPVWLTGTTVPATNSACTTVGTLYSNPSGLWLCANTTAGLVWASLP